MVFIRLGFKIVIIMMVSNSDGIDKVILSKWFKKFEWILWLIFVKVFINMLIIVVIKVVIIDKLKV